MNADITDPPAAHGPTLLRGTLKQQASNFRVSEVLDIEFQGKGEHLYLQVEKSSMNTDEVLSVLQACYGVGSADIGLCGLKDRHSVASQWFSIRTPQTPDMFEHAAAQFNAQQQDLWAEAGGYLKTLRLLHSARHGRKLKRGAHRCNHFTLTLTDIVACDDVAASLTTAVDMRLQSIAAHGFPGYIGPQRFGHGAQNLQRARQWFARPRKRCSRQQRSLWFSAARSAIFNSVCAARVREGSWQALLDGEPAALDGSRSFFTTDGEQSLASRLAALDIHPSAPWWGRGRTPATGACAQFEALHMQSLTDLCEGLERGGLTQERRALRAVATQLNHRWIDTDTLELTFSLSPGVFATTLLRELGTLTEPQR